jgi:hypothetical protein
MAQKSQQRNDAEGIAQTLINEVAFARQILESVDEGEIKAMSDEELVDLRSEIKELEGDVEDFRKELVESELETRVDPGERLLGLNRVKSHSKYVVDDPSTVVARATAKGIDIDTFTKIKASKLADVAPELAEIGRSEYTYFR